MNFLEFSVYIYIYVTNLHWAFKAEDYGLTLSISFRLLQTVLYFGNCSL